MLRLFSERRLSCWQQASSGQRLSSPSSSEKLLRLLQLTLLPLTEPHLQPQLAPFPLLSSLFLQLRRRAPRRLPGRLIRQMTSSIFHNNTLTIRNAQQARDTADRDERMTFKWPRRVAFCSLVADASECGSNSAKIARHTRFTPCTATVLWSSPIFNFSSTFTQLGHILKLPLYSQQSPLSNTAWLHSFQAIYNTHKATFPLRLPNRLPGPRAFFTFRPLLLHESISKIHPSLHN